MTKWIQKLLRKIFQKPEEEDDQDSLTRKEEELSSPLANLLKEKPIPKRSLSEYLAEHPQKEKLFLEKMQQEWNKSEPQPVVSFWLRLAFPGVALVLVCIFVVYYRWSFSEIPSSEQALTGRLENSSEQKTKAILSKKLMSGEKEFHTGDKIKVSDPKGMIHLKLGENLSFKVFGNSEVSVQTLPDEKNNLISLFIHKGAISIDSSPGQKPKIEWVTKNFQYVPTGTKALLVVNSQEERLEVREGSFRRTDRNSGSEKEILAGSSIRFFEPQEPPKPVEKYYLPGTIHLKNGKTYTGYYFQEKGKVIMKANNDFYEWSDLEVESIE